MGEIDKMIAVKDKSQLIGEFFDYLQSKSIRLCEWVERKPVCGFDDYADDHSHDEGCYNVDTDSFVPICQSIEQVLADYFGIDLKKVEAEKQKILEDLRKGK